MTAVTNIQKRTITVMHNTGFTFLGDSHFSNISQAKRCLGDLEKIGFTYVVQNEFGKQYELTELGRHFAKWGFTDHFTTSVYQ